MDRAFARGLHSVESEDIPIERLKVAKWRLARYEHNLLALHENLNSFYDKLFSKLSTPTLETPVVEPFVEQVEDYLRHYFKRRRRVYPSDVANALGLDYETVRKAFDQLLKEEKVELVHKMARRNK